MNLNFLNGRVFLLIPLLVAPGGGRACVAVNRGTRDYRGVPTVLHSPGMESR